MAGDILAVACAVINASDPDSFFRVCEQRSSNLPPAELRDRLNAQHKEKSFKSVLKTLDSAAPVLAALKEAREFIDHEKLAAAEAFAYLVREFVLPEKDPVVQAILRFAKYWEEKSFVRDTSLAEFLKYLG